MNLTGLMGVGGLEGHLVGGLGASYAGLRALRALLGSCSAMWARRGAFETAALGPDPRAAARRLCWGHLPPKLYHMAEGSALRSVFAFAAGDRGYAVFGWAPDIRGAVVWFKTLQGTVWREVSDCSHGHALLMGPADPPAEPHEGVAVGQWVAVSYELHTGRQAVALFDGRLEPIFTALAPPDTPPLSLCSGVSSDGCGHVCAFGGDTCVLMKLGVFEGHPCVESRRVHAPARIRGGAVLGDALCLVMESAVWAVSLAHGTIQRVCTGRGFTGAACGLEPVPGRPGLALMLLGFGVVWWPMDSPRLFRPWPTMWRSGESYTLTALDARRLAVVGVGGHIQVLSWGSPGLDDDFRVGWQPPRQMHLVAAPDGRACIAALRTDNTLVVFGDAGLCHLPVGAPRADRGPAVMEY